MFLGGNCVICLSKKHVPVRKLNTMPRLICVWDVMGSLCASWYRCWCTLSYANEMWQLIRPFIVSNLVFHERIKVDCHFIRDLLMQKQIVIMSKSEDRLVTFLPNHWLVLSSAVFVVPSWACLISMLAPAWRGVLEFLS
jgi:hypothetical protein